MDVDINEFRSSILNDAHVNASTSGNSPREAFLELYLKALREAEVFEDFELLDVEGIGSRGRRIQIDGYYYDDFDSCLDVVICHFTDNIEMETLTLTEANIFFRRAQAFVEESLSGFILKNWEESSPGYDLAVDIREHFLIHRYRFYLVTDIVMSDRMKEIPETEIADASAEYHIWDIGRLQALWASKTGKEPITINLKTFSTSGIPCLEAGSTSEYMAYLCNIPGKMLADLYNRYGGRLLEGNVRSFLTAKGKINKGIRNTILNEPDKFFAYNNGIAATASGVHLVQTTKGTFIEEITDLQIVNGGQTTVSLANVLLNDKDRAHQLHSIFVPMKLSVVPDPDEAEKLMPAIAKYANMQNKVSDADFFSNHAFHGRMEQFSRRLIAPAIKGRQYGTYWYYERARGQYRQEQARMTKAEKDKFLVRNPKLQMFTKTDLAKYHEIYRMLPHQVSMGAQKNFSKFADWAATAWEKDDRVFNEEFFRQMVALIILFRTTDVIVKRASPDRLGYKAQVVAYTLSILFYVIKRDYSEKAFDFRRVWNRQSITEATEHQIAEIAEKVYGYLTAPNREVDNVTEWAKREICWKRAQVLPVTLRKDFIEELISSDAQKEAMQNAKDTQEQDNKVSAMVAVADYGVERWKALLQWGRDNQVFSPMEISFVNAAIAMERGRFPSEKQCAKIMQVLEKARQESYPG